MRYRYTVHLRNRQYDGIRSFVASRVEVKGNKTQFIDEHGLDGCSYLTSDIIKIDKKEV